MVVAKKKTAEHGVLLKGNFGCAGCGSMIAMRMVTSLYPDRAVLVIPASCSSVYQGPFPKYAFNAPTINTPFAASDAFASGVARMMKRRKTNAVVTVWAGDGGTSDIGLATLSGAAERNEDILHIMYDNNAYMNTGVQKSGSTPREAKTTTTPYGKSNKKKVVARIMVAHDVPYVATASIAYPRDLKKKIETALNIKGFKFIQIDSPCPPGWNYDAKYTVTIAKLAVKTGFWPLWEYKDGKITISTPSVAAMNPEKRTPLEELLKYQGRFKGLKPEEIEQLKNDIDEEWKQILKLKNDN